MLTSSLLPTESGTKASSQPVICGLSKRDLVVAGFTAIIFVVLLAVCVAIAVPLTSRHGNDSGDDNSEVSTSSSTRAPPPTTESSNPIDVDWDILIFGGTVVDGSGLTRFKADVAIKDGYFVSIGSKLVGAATKIINATGLIVSAGFIDAHTHSDFLLAADIDGDSKLRDGITTEFTGMCGMSLGPCTGECIGWRESSFLATIPTSVLDQITTFGDEIAWFKNHPPATNLMLIAGYNTVRASACGFAINCTQAQINNAKTMVHDAMLAGSWGLSTGLEYNPSVYSTTAELIQVTQEAANLGGFYISHMRSEDISILAAVDEVIAISKATGIKSQISHLKIASQLLTSQGDALLNKIDTAVSSGIDLWADQYPYNAYGTNLDFALGSSLNQLTVEQRKVALENETILDTVRTRYTSGAIFEYLGVRSFNDVIAVSTGNDKWNGKTLVELGAVLSKDPFDAWIYVLINTSFTSQGVYFAMNETLVQRIMKHPRVMFGSDGSSVRIGGVAPSHPRFYGAASRSIGHYGRDLGLYSLERAVYRMTGMPAKRYGIPKRGQIAIGNHADVTIFDWNTIIDRSTFSDMAQYSTGINHVIINGIVALENSIPTGVKTGSIIYGPAYTGDRN